MTARQHIPSSIALAIVCVLAGAIRLLPPLFTGSLVDGLEYDGGAMLSAAFHLLAGNTPFVDFIYLHPPGSLVLFAPAAMLADILGEHGSLAVVRGAIILTGIVNTLLIGMLLRRFGVTAVVVGAGMYAVWPVVALTERMVMLEPILNLCLLAALAITRRGSRIGGTWVAGVLLGVALSVKFWAVFDVVLVGMMLTARFGWRGLWRYLAAGAATASAIVLPFFVRAPTEMWDQTVVTQLSRPATRTSLADRINMLSAFYGTPALDDAFPWIGWAVLWLGLLGLATVPIVIAARARSPLREWPDPAWWGLIAITHAIVVGASAVFYDHYATWLIAPLALATGAATIRIRRRVMRRAVVIGSGALILVVLIPLLVPRQQAPAFNELRVAAQRYDCLWGNPDTLIAADAVSRGIAVGCQAYVDPVGVELVAASGTTAGEQSFDEMVRGQLDAVDGAIIPADPASWPFPAETARWFTRNFTLVGDYGGQGIWARTTDQ